MKKNTIINKKEVKTIKDQYESFNPVGLIWHIKDGELDKMAVNKAVDSLEECYSWAGITPEEDIPHTLTFTFTLPKNW